MKTRWKWRSLQYGVHGDPYNMASMAILTIWRQWRSLQYGVNGAPYNMASMALLTIWRQWPLPGGWDSSLGIPRAPPAGLRPASGARGIPARRAKENGNMENGKWKNGKMNFLWDFGKWEFFGFFGKWKNGKWDFFEIFFVGLFIFWKWKNGELKKKNFQISRVGKWSGRKCNKKLSGENLRAAGGFFFD